MQVFKFSLISAPSTPTELPYEKCLNYNAELCVLTFWF